MPDPYAEMERLAKLIQCPACQARIEKRSKVCPKCGAALTSRVRHFARFAGISVFVLALAVPLLWPAGVWPRKEEVFSADTSGLTLTGQVWKKAAGNNLTFVNGLVTNNSNRPFFLLKVEVDLVNNAGAVVGTGSDQVATLDGHKSWGFKVLVIDPEAVSAQPAKLTYQP